MFAQNEKIRYDSHHDVLYIFLGEAKMGYEDEVSPGIFLRKADDTDEVIGVIIMNFQNIDRNKLMDLIPFSINTDIYNTNRLQN